MKSVINKVRNIPWYAVFAKVNNRIGSNSLFIITSENYYNKVNALTWLEAKQAADNETYEQLKRL